jgi:hypothetical protein
VVERETVPEERKLEADKLQMEYFKQIGTFSLAGAVAIANLPSPIHRCAPT